MVRVVEIVRVVISAVSPWFPPCEPPLLEESDNEITLVNFDYLLTLPH